MASGGNSSDLDSELNVPADYYNIMADYIKQQLFFERSIPQDTDSNGQDNNLKQL
jgi:hypothetical protein